MITIIIFTNQQYKEDTIFSSLREFYTHSMIIMADAYNNIYHKKLHLSYDKTRHILDEILFTS